VSLLLARGLVFFVSPCLELIITAINNHYSLIFLYSLKCFLKMSSIHYLNVLWRINHWKVNFIAA
jgi:hypothetical protein